MKEINIYKASPLHTGQETPSVVIRIDREIPTLDKPTPPFENVYDEARVAYRKEASALVGALVNALPGGVLDQVLIELMTRKASLFRVPFGDAAPALNVEEESWKAIKKAAAESDWMPPEYMANDWVYDVCEFLRHGNTPLRSECTHAHPPRCKCMSCTTTGL